MKTEAMSQQVEALRRSNGREFYCLAMEQGTGKTWTLLAEAERLYAAGRIDAVLVVAPSGVHTNWIRREIPTHLEVPHIAVAWRSGMGVRETKEKMSLLFAPRRLGAVPPLRILAINFESLLSKSTYSVAAKFCGATKCMIIVDESDRIKNPRAAITKKLLTLQPRSVVRRIATGTPITQMPADAFSQFEFLEEGLLGTTSYRAFMAEYADLVDMEDKDNRAMQKLLEKNPRMRHAQIVARDSSGRPRYKNLDKLRRLMAPHMYRVLKKDCLDLPEKIFTSRYFELTPPQRKAYELMKKECRILLENNDEVSVAALAALQKLQQITSGFVKHPTEDRYIYQGDNARLDALMEEIASVEGQCIIFARYREELRSIEERLAKEGETFVSYHGGISRDDREAAIDNFQAGKARFFVANTQAAGVGLTLTAAQTTIYYANYWSLRLRLQSEDRNHRIGTKGDVRYVDLVAEDTIDEAIAKSLQNKASMAAAILETEGLELPPAILAKLEDDPFSDVPFFEEFGDNPVS